MRLSLFQTVTGYDPWCSRRMHRDDASASGARDNPVVWREQFDAGVDLINTDNLEGLRKFLLKRER